MTLQEERAIEKIASVTANHTSLKPDLYVSRKDRSGDVTLTPFDSAQQRACHGNCQIHTIEHLEATFLRNDPERGGVLRTTLHKEAVTLKCTYSKAKVSMIYS